MIAGRKFQFRPVLTVCAGAALAILIALGNWQLMRMAWKNNLLEIVEQRANEKTASPFEAALGAWEMGYPMEYTRVKVRGEYAHALEKHAFGTFESVPGYYIFTPLKVIDDAAGEGELDHEYLFVNRGFVPQSEKEKNARVDGLVDGVVEVTGLFREPQERPTWAGLFEPKSDAEKNIWFARNVGIFAEESGISAPPVFIDSDGSENPAAWPKGGTTRLDFRNKHLEYALTWFGLAGALIGVWFAMSLRPATPGH